MAMIIKLSPQQRDDRYSLARVGDKIILNGEEFDFSPLPEGATLPADAIGSEWFCGPVDRVLGDIHITLILPHGANPPSHVAFPEAMVVSVDGQVEVPK